MGSFSAERSSILNSLGSYTDVLKRRKDALMAVQSLSAQLLDMLSSGNLDDLSEVIDRRDKACAFLSKTMTGNPELWDVIARARKASPDETVEPAKSVFGLDDDIRAILADVVEKQQKCEDLLKAEIARTSELLKQSAAKRKLNAAYGPANARPEARFLDSTR